MADFNISSANATASLTVDDLFPAGIDLQMFGTDQALKQESSVIVETRVGIDGRMVAGYKPDIIRVTLTLEAASPSLQDLSVLWSAMRSRKTIYECTLVCSVPSINRVFSWSRGVLVSGTPFPSLGKDLRPTDWQFHFQNFDLQKL